MEGFSTVSIKDGNIYTTGMIEKRGYLFAIDNNGKLKWKKEYGPEWAGSHPGTRTTPTIDEDRLYIMSGQGRIACFNRNHGELIWKVDTLEKFQGKNITWGIAESVLIDGDKVFCTPGGKDASIVALNKHTGQLVARDDEQIGARLFKGQWSSPSSGVVGGRRLVFFGGGAKQTEIAGCSRNAIRLFALKRRSHSFL